jgi:copper transport protein
LVVPSDLLHVTAGAVWFGGLVGLAVTIPALAKRESLIAVTMERFSSVAASLLAGVAAAGMLLGWRIVGSWAGLVETRYGLMLLAKVALVGLVVVVAAWNRYRLLPAVTQATGHQERLSAAATLRTAVRVEAGGLVVALLITGFLVNQVPRDVSASNPEDRSTVTATADDIRVVAHLEPGRVGANTVTVQVQNLAGEPVEPYAPPLVAVASESLDLGDRPVRNIDSGTYEAAFVIPEPGAWSVSISVRTGEFDNPVLTLTARVEQGAAG